MEAVISFRNSHYDLKSYSRYENLFITFDNSGNSHAINYLKKSGRSFQQTETHFFQKPYRLLSSLSCVVEGKLPNRERICALLILGLKFPMISASIRAPVAC